MAQQIGTATAVNPSTEGTPPGGSTTTLTVGARVLHKERIHTSPTGSVQLLFLDKSTLSIAPNTSLVIDEFVYDPTSTPILPRYLFCTARCGLALATTCQPSMPAIGTT